MSRILLVEDDKALREIYGIRLHAEGYEIVEAQDGEAGLTQAVAVAPDLIISDAMMPKISGFEMLDLLKSNEKTKGIKVIMMTALSSSSQRERGEKLGADLYLVKSQVGIEDLVQAVHYVLRDRLTNATTTAPTSTNISAPIETTQASSTALNTAAIPPRPMSIPTIMNPINPTAQTQAAPEVQGVAAVPIVPIDPVARLVTQTPPIASAQSIQRPLAPVPVPAPIPSAATPAVAQPLVPLQQQTQFIGQNPALDKANSSSFQPSAIASDSDAPMTAPQYTIGGPSGMGRVIQPIQETLHPKVDIDALLANNEANDHDPIVTASRTSVPPHRFQEHLLTRR